MSLRCAAYARYSTDKQSPLSIEDQLRKCREFARQQGWHVMEEYIYTDEALSGATDERTGLRQLLEAAALPGPLFDVVLIDDTSRLSRKLVDSLRICEHLLFAGVRIVFVSQGIDTNSEQAEVLPATHGIVDSLYIRELGKKVYRGVEGRALKGLHTGGRCFGYRSQPIEDLTRTDNYGRPVILGVRLVVDEAEAAVVRRICTTYAAGHSLKRIAKILNAEGVQSPQPQKGRLSRSWCPSAVRKILHNDRYRGLLIWGKTRKLRSPKTGKRIYRHRPPTEWVMAEVPQQRIVSDELWDGVQQRLAQVKRLYGNPGRKPGLLRAQTANSSYLFSGLIKCCLCGANMTIVSGRGNRRPHASYGCPLNTQRGVCSNSLRIRKDVLERGLLRTLQVEVLRPEVVDYTLRRFEQELLQSVQAAGEGIAGIRQRETKLKEEIRNLTQAIANGHFSTLLMQEIAVREKELAGIAERLLEAQPEAVGAQLKDVRRFVVSRLADLPDMLNSNAVTARTELAKHVQAIKLYPEGNAYRASGTWDFLPEGRMGGAAGRS